MNKNQFLTFNGFQQKFQLKCNFLQYYGLLSTIPQQWKDMIKHPNSQESAASTIDIDRLPYKTLYNLTISSKNLPPPTSDSQLIITTCGFVSNKRHVIYSLPFQVMCHTHSHTCFAFFITFFPTDFQAKERQLAVY